MDDQKINNVQASYDKVAGEYVKRIYNELEHKPLDRQLLDQFAESMRGRGRVCDLGCGPGHVAAYLGGRGVDVCGIDLSPAMVAEARRLNPCIQFEQGDMLSLRVADEAWAGIVAFYSIIHINREEVTRALLELRRVLRPDGLLLLAFHIGEEVLHLDEWWGEQVAVDFIFFRPNEMEGYLKSAGFVVDKIIEREPYEGFEHPSRRAYIFARKPQNA
jgi:SAM-dependent methyltransferase